MAKTPLLSDLLRAWRRMVREEPVFHYGNRDFAGGGGGSDWSRRDFLRASLGGLLACNAVLAADAATTRRNSAPGRSTPTQIRVGIVGAGLAGLAAADVLVRSSAEVLLFDARTRVGGRVRSIRDALGPDLPGELGAEFINSDHTRVLALARRFKLPILDTMTAGEEAFRPVYWINDAVYPLERAARDLGEFLSAHIRDLKLAAAAPGCALVPSSISKELRDLDALSISDYLNARGCPQPLRGLIETAYTTEYGAAASDQSVLNFLIMFAEESPESFKAGHGDDTSPDVLGSSDERYKFVLGSECLPKALLASVVASRPAAAPRLEHRLVAIRPVSGDPHSALQLVLDQGGGNEVIHEVDRVILALPFNQLRKVDLTGLQLDPEKKRAIQELGYGRSGKFICGTNGRPWRGAGHNGSAYLSSPQPVLTWDTTRSRPGDNGGLSFFLAGDGTTLLQQKSGEELEALLRPALEKALPELRGMDITRTLKANWPAEAYIEAGYTALRPGQWTAFSGIEAQAAMDGRLLFAGEHTSVAYQGYMEGAIESGQRAAKEALANISDQRRRTRQ